MALAEHGPGNSPRKSNAAFNKPPQCSQCCTTKAPVSKAWSTNENKNRNKKSKLKNQALYHHFGQQIKIKQTDTNCYQRHQPCCSFQQIPIKTGQKWEIKNSKSRNQVVHSGKNILRFHFPLKYNLNKEDNHQVIWFSGLFCLRVLPLLAVHLFEYPK